VDKLRYFIRESWLLIICSIFFGGMLAATDAAWKDKIEKNKQEKFNRKASELLGGDVKYEVIEKALPVDLGKGKPTPVELIKGTRNGVCAGWTFKCIGKGFGGDIEMVVAVDAGFEKIMGFRILASSETPGFGDKLNIVDGFYQSQFKGAPVGDLKLIKMGDNKKIDNQIVAISGATVSSTAVVKGFNVYLPQIKKWLTEKGMLSRGQ
jgi:electron transport complex protein RnfG